MTITKLSRAHREYAHTYRKNTHLEERANELDVVSRAIEAAEPVVYAIRAKATNVVKIGVSEDPDSRLASLQTANADELELMGYIPGSTTLEAAIHKLLSAYRVRGEWFQYCGGAKAIIDAIAAADFDGLERGIERL